MIFNPTLPEVGTEWYVTETALPGSLAQVPAGRPHPVFLAVDTSLATTPRFFFRESNCSMDYVVLRFVGCLLFVKTL